MENLEPLDPVQVGICCQCGGEIYAGEYTAHCDEGLVHRECVWEHLYEKIGPERVSVHCGYVYDAAE